VDGYERFFGLSEAPFSLAPNPRFLFESASHAMVLAQVAYALERREPVVVVTGEIGTGKTLLCRTVLERLEQKTFLSVIDDPLLDRDDLLRRLLEDFGVISKDRSRQTAAGRHELVDTLQAFLRSLAPIGAHAVVVIDEAQHLQPDVLEQIRLLSNMDDPQGTLLQIVLVGQTDLDALLARPDLRQLHQRVSRHLRMRPLDAHEVEQYIEHRLAKARGGADASAATAPGRLELEQALAGSPWATADVDFTPDAMAAVATLSAGLPRVINLVCDRALEAAYAARLRTIDRGLVNVAAVALGLPEAAPPRSAIEAFAPEPALPAAVDGLLHARSSVTDDDPALSVRFAEEVPGLVHDAPDAPASPPRRRKVLAFLAAAGVAGLAVWMGIRAGHTSPGAASSPARAVRGPDVPVAQPAPPQSQAVEPGPSLAQGNAPGSAVAPPAAAPPAAAGPPPLAPMAASPAAPPAPVPALAPAADERAEIIVASFRTESRATAVAAGVSALGLPVRQRASDGWQQVVAGPFASRAEARDAQQRLDQAGFGGTHIGLVRPATRASDAPPSAP
jgi:general secretion pathway protein A